MSAESNYAKNHETLPFKLIFIQQMLSFTNKIFFNCDINFPPSELTKKHKNMAFFIYSKKMFTSTCRNWLWRELVLHSETIKTRNN